MGSQQRRKRRVINRLRGKETRKGKGQENLSVREVEEQCKERLTLLGFELTGAALIVLRDDFGFTQEQLRAFSRRQMETARANRMDMEQMERIIQAGQRARNEVETIASAMKEAREEAKDARS